MGLRARTLWAGGLLLATLLGGAYAGMAVFLGSHFTKLEEEQTLRDGRLALKGVEREVIELGGKISDWSDWDDAYEFMKTQDTGFVRANLDTTVLSNMRLREIQFMDLKGRFVAGLAQFEGRRAPVHAGLLNWLSSPAVVGRIVREEGLQGWYMDGDTPLLVVSRPIRPTSRNAAPRGILTFVRSFGPDEIRRLETVFPFGIAIDEQKDATGEFLQWRLSHRSDTLRAECQFAGLDDRRLRLEVVCPRRFDGQKSMLMLWLAVAFVVTAVVFAASGLILLERLVLRRLFHLEQDVAGIASGSSLRVHVAGSDEIARLAGNIDQMVESLRRATVELRRTRDLSERAERAKTRLLASVSHEMRTPLNGILGLADLLRRSTHISMEDRENVDMVAEAGSQLLLTVNTLLDHSRLETGDLDLLRTDFCLEEIVGHALVDVMPMAHRKGLAVHVEFEPDLPAAVLGDPDRVRQLLRNLLDNAVKFTVTGEVRLSVARSAQENALSFVIADTGIGIESGRLQEIFRPFEQAGADTFFAFGGIGLGLSISRLLAEHMNGRIDVQSVPGKGSVFSVQIQLPAKDGAGLLLDPLRWQGLEGRRVVVAHPRAGDRAVLAKILGRVGIVVLEATSPDDLVRLDAQAGVLWGFDDAGPAGCVRICPRDGHEKDASQALLFAPYLPSEVLHHCCQLLRSPLKVGLYVPNAVLRTLVGGILRKVGHVAVPFDPVQPDLSVDVVVMDVRDGEEDLEERVVAMRRDLPSVAIVILVGTFQMGPHLGGCHRVKRPVDAAALLWEVEGWGRARR